MKFSLDTNNCEKIHIEIEENEANDLSSAIQEFAFGLASFFINFMAKLNCDTKEKATEVRNICMSCINNNLDFMIKEILVDDIDEDLEVEIEELLKAMSEKGFSEKECSNIADIVRGSGSMSAAIGYLKRVGEDNGIVWDEEEEQ